MGMKRQKRERYVYPQINFKVASDEEKARLLRLIDETHEALNRGRDETAEYSIKKHEIITAALLAGLPLVRSGKAKIKG